jgi:hypothetical protein
MGEEQKLDYVLDELFFAGIAVSKPRKILVNVLDTDRDKDSPHKVTLRIEITFFATRTVDPDELFDWNVASNLPGRVQFAMHLSRLYVALMGGDFSVSHKKGRMVFHLDLCKEEL